MKYFLPVITLLVLINSKKLNAQLGQAHYNDAEVLYKQGKSLSAAKLYQSFISKTQDSTERLDLYLKMSGAYTAAKSNDKALAALENANLYLVDNPTTAILSRMRLQYAQYYFSIGDYDQAATEAVSALDDAEKSQDQEQILRCNNQLGKIYLLQKNIAKAKSYFVKSRMLAERLNDELLRADNDCFMGQLLFENKEYEQAAIKIKKALEVYDRNSNNRGILVSKGFLSKIYFFSGDVQQATKYSFDVLPLLKEFEFDTKTQKLLNNTQKLAKLAKSKDTTAALKQATELVKENISITEKNNIAVSIEQKKGVVNYIKTTLNTQSAKVQKIDTSIIDNAMNLVNEQDSMYQEALQNRLLDIETKYQTEKKEKELLLQKAINDEQAAQMQLQVGGIVALVIGLGIITFFYRKNKKQKEIIANQKEGINNVMDGMHHGVENSLKHVQRVLSNARSQTNDIQASTVLTDASRRLVSVSLVYKHLYDHGIIGKIELSEYLSDIINSMLESYSERIQVEQDIVKPLELSRKWALRLGIIAHEFITNSVKHAFTDTDNPSLSISLAIENDKVIYSLSDNGIGANVSQLEKSGSFGIRTISNIAQELKGDISWKNENGLSLRIRFDKETIS